MKIAVTQHAVDRYRERVQGARDMEKESVRAEIRRLIREGFEKKTVRDHPTEGERRIVPFQSGSTPLFISIGPNTTNYDAEIAAIGVLWESELGGKVGMGVKIGDIAALQQVSPSKQKPPKYLVFIGVERYEPVDEEALEALCTQRACRRSDMVIYRLFEQ